MRGVLAPFLAVTLLVAGCGGSGTSSTPATEPGESATTSALVTTGTNVPPSTEAAAASTTPEVPTTRSESPPSTEPRPTTTSADQTSEELAVLRPGGLGEVDFGTLADEAVVELTALLGSPDRIEVLAPIGLGGDGCVEGGSWLDCLRERRIVDEGRLAVWGDYGLTVALVDTTDDYGPPGQTALQFADWHATVAPGNRRLVTVVEGLYPGMTVEELRQVVPGVEFGYNEGLLDSFFVAAGDPGWFWGRLDWDPRTDDIEYWDVSAIQAALNEHGAKLVVDGDWGSRSETAWLDFLTDLGVEPFVLAAQWPVWLTPEIGEALGLPPDDITVATLGPRPATETVEVSLPILRSDGLDRFDLGEPANDLVAEIEAILGPAADDMSYTPDGAGPFSILPMGYWAAYELRIVVWERPDLYLVLSDVPWLGDEFGEATPGTLSLVSWETSSPRFTDGNNLAVGSSLADLRFHHPNVVLGTFDVCETEYNPAAFVTMPYDGDTPPLWRGLRGTTDWDWVSDLQIALNDRGASLVIDGEYGPRTSAAVAALEQEIGVHRVDGQIDPEVADALALQAPTDAALTGLEAGYPGSC